MSGENLRDSDINRDGRVDAADLLILPEDLGKGRQLAAQAGAFEKNGGFGERLHRIRTARRFRPSP